MILITVATSIYAILPVLMTKFKPDNNKFIGIVVKSQGDLKMRFGNSINWKSAKTNDKIYSQTYLFTGPASSAVYGFIDNSTIKLGENSLIFMDFVASDANRRADDSIALDLVEGQIELNLREKSPLKKIIIEDAVIDITKKQKTIIQLNYQEEAGLDIAVLHGDIDINQKNVSYNIKQGEKVGVTSSGKLTPPELDEQTKEKIRNLSKEDHEKIVNDLKSKRQLSRIFLELLDEFKNVIK